jgi:hypothetical protein
MCTGARVVAVKNDLAKLQLTSPVCTSAAEKVALSRRVDKHCAWPAASVVCCACLHGSCAQGASLVGPDPDGHRNGGARLLSPRVTAPARVTTLGALLRRGV